MSVETKDIENVVIVGSGPAGYTAALYTSRADLEPLVIEGFAWGGLLQQTTDVENYPGYPEGVMGPQMMEDLRRQAERFGTRFITDDATKLPNASNESGLGLDTTDFYMSLLGAKTVQSIRFVGNLGFGILADPTVGNRQNDVLTYGVSLARAMTQQAELVGELNGRVSTRTGGAFPGTETRGLLKAGGRYTRRTVRLDAAVAVGLTAADPDLGFTWGVTYVFNAFTLP